MLSIISLLLALLCFVLLCWLLGRNPVELAEEPNSDSLHDYINWFAKYAPENSLSPGENSTPREIARYLYRLKEYRPQLLPQIEAWLQDHPGLFQD